MKYVQFDTEAEAIAENARLEGLLGIPEGNTVRYTTPMEWDGTWLIKVTVLGTWKCDQYCDDIVEIDTSPMPGE